MTWYPADPRLTRWLELYHQVAHNNGAEPDAGRRLLSWAMAAGYRDISSSASVWVYATEEERAWWGNTWAERVTTSDFGQQAIAAGFTDQQELVELAVGWRDWAGHPDGWFAVLNSEILCRID